MSKFFSKISGAILLAGAQANLALAQTASDGGVGNKVKGTADTLLTILNTVSVIVITIAFIFAGYQMAFNNKRFNDIAPVLIGGLVVGAAGMLAKMLIPTT